ncbi:hypothetical protein RFI_40205 [Reticulomyxa filosa]|uniref:Uncharacterized protein n=1 Tax=Reticulomyxa filosa TaxID=46433 RepID=X6L8F5_RETFI|nr:hypothetical protein RFI_40205 [Reticulomyxa filosa]|eukprot:ETN97326.1 hypothetical protein RFI_40205 [Reticulomyxa filosa]
MGKKTGRKVSLLRRLNSNYKIRMNWQKGQWLLKRLKNKKNSYSFLKIIFNIAGNASQREEQKEEEKKEEEQEEKKEEEQKEEEQEEEKKEEEQKEEEQKEEEQEEEQKEEQEEEKRERSLEMPREEEKEANNEQPNPDHFNAKIIIDAVNEIRRIMQLFQCIQKIILYVLHIIQTWNKVKKCASNMCSAVASGMKWFVRMSKSSILQFGSTKLFYSSSNKIVSDLLLPYVHANNVDLVQIPFSTAVIFITGKKRAFFGCKEKCLIFVFFFFSLRIPKSSHQKNLKASPKKSTHNFLFALFSYANFFFFHQKKCMSAFFFSDEEEKKS